MALGPNYKYDEGTDINHFMFEAAEKGVLVIKSGTGGTGLPGDSDNIAIIPTDMEGVSGVPLGLLLTDVVETDCCGLGRLYKDQVTVCNPVTILTHGWVQTDKYVGTVRGGDSAYFTLSGLLTATDSGSVVVGRFGGEPDSDGFVRVDINIGV